MPGLVPGIHVLAVAHGFEDVDGIGTRACPSSAVLSAASRVDPTCGDKPGHDGAEESSHRRGNRARERGQGTAKDEIRGRSQQATDIVVVLSEPGVALMAKQSARPAVRVIVIEAKPRS
jgi:hypothetical protein